MQTKNKVKKLNPQWLLAAWVLDEAGNKIGCIAQVDGDLDTVHFGFKKRPAADGSFERFTASAVQLDAEGRLFRESSTQPKYVARITKRLLHSR